MDLRKRIADGIAGKYQGLANNLGRINEYIYNVQKGWYYLIGGLSGTGKTSLVDFMALAAMKDAERRNIPLEIFYYSYEIDGETKFTQWLSNHIFTTHHTEIPSERIAGLGDYRLSPIEAALVDSELDYFEHIYRKINFRFDPTNPTGIYKELLDYYNANGRILEEDYAGMDDFGKEKTQKRIIGYEPFDPDKKVIVILDHIALTKIERRFSLKENIDKMSEYCVWFRNIFGTTFFVLQQFNQGLHAIERKKYSGEELVPAQNDFKDSGNPFQDCDTALGIFNPHAMGGASKRIFGYDLQQLHRNFRLINIIKNRKGRDGLVYGFYFNPKAGFFKILPRPQDMQELDFKNVNAGCYA